MSFSLPVVSPVSNAQNRCPINNHWMDEWMMTHDKGNMESASSCCFVFYCRIILSSRNCWWKWKGVKLGKVVHNTHEICGKLISMKPPWTQVSLGSAAFVSIMLPQAPRSLTAGAGEGSTTRNTINSIFMDEEEKLLLIKQLVHIQRPTELGFKSNSIWIGFHSITSKSNSIQIWFQGQVHRFPTNHHSPHITKLIVASECPPFTSLDPLTF